jgi:hypothetical protein
MCAKKMDADLVITHPATSDTVDPKGIPFIAPDGKSALFLPFGDVDRLLNAKKKTIWFLDDLGQATPAVQAAYMPYLLERRLGNHVLPDCVVPVAATNRRQDKAGVSGILEPVKSRFHKIINLEPCYQEWRTWAIDSNMPPDIIAFLDVRNGDLFNAFSPTSDMSNSPIPRTWANAGDIMNDFIDACGDNPQDAINKEGELYEEIAGAVGAGAAGEFVGFRKMRFALPHPDSIIADPENALVPDHSNALFAITMMLVYKANEDNFTQIMKYAKRMNQNGHGEYVALLLRDSERKHPELKQTNAYIRAITGELGQLLTGQSH